MDDNEWQILFSDKVTNSGADQLQAMGLAVLADNILSAAGQRGGYVLLRDEESHYTIRLAKPIKAEYLRLPGRVRLYEPLRLASNADELRGMETFDYDRQREQSAAYWENYRAARKVASATGDIPLRLEEVTSARPHHQLPLYSGIRAFNLHEQVNDLARYWYSLTPAVYENAIQALLDTFSRRPNNLDALAATWRAIAKRHDVVGVKEMVSQLQITTGIAGMGANRTKADGVVRFDKTAALWLIEWLKVGGFFHLAVPMAVSAGGDKKQAGKGKGTAKGKASDRKTYILRPHSASVGVIDTVLKRFREGMRSSTALKLDILAALHFVEAFYEIHEQRIEARQQAAIDPATTPPERCTAMVHGFDVISSKNMSSANVAFATMNLATVNLPDWLPKVPANGTFEQQGEIVKEALELLREHITMVRLIGWRSRDRTEEGAEELELLRHYRDFLSSRGDLNAFLAFTDVYGPYIVAQRSRARLVKQLTTTHLEVLVSNGNNEDYRKIVTNPGFRNIARCIRDATVKPQFLKSRITRKGDGTLSAIDSPYEVRYGLSQDFSRAAQEGDEKFLIVLGEFLNECRVENSRVLERMNRDALAKGLAELPQDKQRQLRRSHTTTDLEQIVYLTYDFHAPLVCSLLLAYGYARDDSDPVTQDDTAKSQADVPEDDPDDSTL